MAENYVLQRSVQLRISAGILGVLGSTKVGSFSLFIYMCVIHYGLEDHALDS